MRNLHFESTELSLGAKALRRAGAVLAPIVSVPIALAVVTKSATNSVDSNCSIYGLFIPLCRKVSVDSVNSV